MKNTASERSNYANKRPETYSWAGCTVGIFVVSSACLLIPLPRISNLWAGWRQSILFEVKSPLSGFMAGGEEKVYVWMLLLIGCSLSRHKGNKKCVGGWKGMAALGFNNQPSFDDLDVSRPSLKTLGRFVGTWSKCWTR